MFWFGDLNYRVDMERSAVDQFVRESHTDGWLPLLLHDQLTKEMLNGTHTHTHTHTYTTSHSYMYVILSSGNVFQGFSEQPIQFPPSYKFDTESDSYDSSEKQRTPSWTVPADRTQCHTPIPVPHRTAFCSAHGEGLE